jgi:prepilin-type N-terminal cleavage/methylation domain-containing protein
MRLHFGRLAASDRRRGPSAFTLVELLVVIGVIALLIGILMPVLSKARAQANRAVCLSNIRQLGTGILMYCNDNDGWFPTCAFGNYPPAYRQYPDDWVHWEANRNLDDSAVAKHVGRGDKLKELLRCPADVFDGRRTIPGMPAGQGPYLYSYGLNDALGANVASFQFRTKITRWRSPSRKIMMTEGGGQAQGPGLYEGAAWGFGIPLTIRHGTTRFRGHVPGNSILYRGAKVGANVSAVFLDGHAESIDEHVANNRIHEQPQAR